MGLHVYPIAPYDHATAAVAYEPELPVNYFEDLETALGYLPNCRRVYQAYHEVFRAAVDHLTEHTRLNLVGDFAKIDYILKECQAPMTLSKAINDTRVRLRHRSDLADEELRHYVFTDLRHLCQFLAFVAGEAIPDALAAKFQEESAPEAPRRLVGEVVRLIVEQWDDDYIYGSSDEALGDGRIRVCYTQGNRLYPYDWSYLRDILYSGAQINVLRPREEQGVLYPELIIFEPDYLVNVSTVAGCFAHYAESPLVQLLKKIEPAPSSEAIVLGNFAGQLLDEQLHHLPHTHAYADSVKRFWEHSALSMLTTEVKPTFHEEAQRQKAHIAKALDEDLPQSVASFNRDDCMVEPSFFSELLGLQGRMDCLQLDYKLLFEQKSGKGANHREGMIRPIHREEHYVQMLLYMLIIRYNFREVYERNHQELHAFLLYSKYPESLLGLSFASELIFRALKIRNTLAWTELQYAQKDGFRVLETLTAELMNKKQVSGPLWERYEQPQINALLEPIHRASDLERAYYFRFLTFIAQEHLLSKIGSKTKECSGFASKWYDSLDDKLQAGNIYAKLTLVEPNERSKGPVRAVVLRFCEDESNNMSNFRVGDVVILYAYAPGEEPDVRRNMAFRCSIAHIAVDSIELSLNAEQSDPRVFLREAGKLWAIEHDFMDSSYASLYRGMHAFLSAPQERRDLLLLQREPTTDETLRLNGDYGAFNDLVLAGKQARDFFLIIGPPGTGKTSYGLLNALREELTRPEASVLLLSFTNRAVDEICDKLEQSGLEYIRLGSPLSCSEASSEKLLSRIACKSHNIAELRTRLAATRIMVATTTAMNTHVALFRLKQFSLAIIDEASQILEPHLLGILSACHEGRAAISKFIMIGDQKQLPAVVQQTPEVSQVQDVALNQILLTDCRLSLFERLLSRYRGDRRVVYMLTRQGRMHRDIALFPNYAFYNNRLEVVPLAHQLTALPCVGKLAHGIDNLLATRRIAFLHVDSPKEATSDKVNLPEAQVIAATVRRIYELTKERFEPERTVGVIVPYRNQIATVRNLLDQSGIPALHDITIDTVERYQGSQRRYIIYGFTIRKYYQLNFLTSNVFVDVDGSVIDRKLNVALTRAEEHLLLVGNTRLLANNFTFYKLMEFVRSKQGLFDVPVDRYVAGDFEVPDYEVETGDDCPADYATTERFRRAFERLVEAPILADPSTQGLSTVFGRNREANLEAIGYGRRPFSNQMTLFDEGGLSPRQQVLVYAYYLMRPSYGSCKLVYERLAPWLTTQVQSTSGRVQLIDVGCGPATCGLAFAERFLQEMPAAVYTGLDPSTEMRLLGHSFLEAMFDGRIHAQMFDSYQALTDDFWQGVSELPSTVVFHAAYFLASVSAAVAQELADKMVATMKRYPLNHYVFLIQQAETDTDILPLRTFRRVLAPYVDVVREETSAVTYRLHERERSFRFCTYLWSSR